MAVVPLRAGAEHRLPAEVTSFIGRRRETTEARRLLSVARLVTITGVGGVGKSRLALRVALDVRRAFPGGVCFVELADVDEPALIGQALADTHSIRTPRPSRRSMCSSSTWRIGGSASCATTAGTSSRIAPSPQPGR